MKPRFWPRQRPLMRETRREADATRQDSGALRFFAPLLLPPLWLEALLRYDPLHIMLQPLVPGNMKGPVPHRLPDSPLFLAQSTVYLPQCYRRRCAPSRGKWLLPLTNAQNGDGLRVRSNLTQSGPLQQDYAHLPRELLRHLARRPM